MAGTPKNGAQSSSSSSSEETVFPLSDLEDALPSPPPSQSDITTDSPAATMLKAVALQRAADKANEMKDQATFGTLSRSLMNIPGMPADLKELFVATQRMILDIQRALSGDVQFPENTQKITKLTGAIDRFFTGIQIGYRAEIDRCLEVEKQLPVISGDLDEMFLHKTFKIWAETIIGNLNKPSREEHVVLASFSALFNQFVCQPSLPLREALPVTVCASIDGAYHAIEKCLELYTQDVGYMIYFKGQMQPLVTRMMSSPRLAEQALAFRKLKDELDNWGQPQPSTPKTPAAGIAPSNEGAVVRWGPRARGATIGSVEGGDAGGMRGSAQKENVSFKNREDASKGV